MELNKLNAWGGIIAFAIILAWIGISVLDNIKISRNYRYTIAATVGWTRTAKGPFVNYKFFVNGKNFESSAPAGKDTLILEGGRYFVKFLPTDPNVSIIIWNKPVPSYIKDPPMEGWVKIPE